MKTKIHLDGKYCLICKKKAQVMSMNILREDKVDPICIDCLNWLEKMIRTKNELMPKDYVHDLNEIIQIRKNHT